MVLRSLVDDDTFVPVENGFIAEQNRAKSFPFFLSPLDRCMSLSLSLSNYVKGKKKKETRSFPLLLLHLLASFVAIRSIKIFE